MTAIDYARARRVLARRDPVMRDLMRAHGPCRLADRQHADPFKALARAIVGQQLSTKAAATIFSRFEALVDGPLSAAAVHQLPDARLRSAGLSGQKTAYLRDLSRHVNEGNLILSSLDHMDDEAVIEALTRVKGVGRWTAEMFLIFRLHRPDVLPVGDLGIVKAVQRAYRLRTAPTPDRLTRLGAAWKPYRSVACWYLWASLDTTPTED